jgi:hypothetical protein
VAKIGMSGCHGADPIDSTVSRSSSRRMAVKAKA